MCCVSRYVGECNYDHNTTENDGQEEEKERQSLRSSTTLKMTLPGLISLLILLSITLLGGFSRLTHGKYTPAFYAYQLDRAPDNGSTKIIPYMDFAVAALLAFSNTRAVGAMLCAVFQFIGVVMRIREDKNAASDLALCLCGVLLMLDHLLGG